MYQGMLTREERERFAYIEGRTAEAALLGDTIDEDNAALDEMRHERDMAQEDNSRLERENDNLTEAVEAAESKALSLESALENAQDEVEALRGQIHAAAVDLL